MELQDRGRRTARRPDAQDFYAAFGVGEDDRHITSIDEDGVALAAIKALSELHTRDQARIATLEREMKTVHAALAMQHRGR